MEQILQFIVLLEYKIWNMSIQAALYRYSIAVKKHQHEQHNKTKKNSDTINSILRCYL